MENSFVYIIYSSRGDCYYKGFSENPFRRLEQHTNAESRYTSKYDDWILVYIEEFASKREALIREKVSKIFEVQILDLLKSTKNKMK
ncbi:MAG: GIY-YIG nuclease family protein [Crocinitomicaceae bacterium]|nr:GIY-YIG nuclease family protein [Crocinitomicaceae bacterium]